MSAELRARCAVHGERDASAGCVACGLSFCRECVTEQRGAVYCKRCLGEQAGKAVGAGWRARAAMMLLAVAGVALLWGWFTLLVRWETNRPMARASAGEQHGD